MLCVSWITLKMYGRASHLLSQVDLGAFHIVSRRQDSWHVLLCPCSALWLALVAGHMAYNMKRIKLSYFEDDPFPLTSDCS